MTAGRPEGRSGGVDGGRGRGYTEGYAEDPGKMGLNLLQGKEAKKKEDQPSADILTWDNHRTFLLGVDRPVETPGWRPSAAGLG